MILGLIILAIIFLPFLSKTFRSNHLIARDIERGNRPRKEGTRLVGIRGRKGAINIDSF